jgi:hypothetical protein
MVLICSQLLSFHGVLLEASMLLYVRFPGTLTHGIKHTLSRSILLFCKISQPTPLP